jgi:hypothetical protein
MYRKTALQTVERSGWGGTYYDSFTHSAMFKSYKPFNFGVQGARLFSSELGSHMVNKKFTHLTLAQGNVHMLPGGVDDYEWFLTADADIDFRITDVLVASNSYPGKGGLPFKIALDRNWLQEPAIIKLPNPDLPLLRILGQPSQLGVNSFEYEVELQTGSLDAYIPVASLAIGTKVISVSTAVSDELNTKYAGDEFGEMFKLQSFCGQFARKAEFTDKFIRTEIAARKDGRMMPKGMTYNVGGQACGDGAVGLGFVYDVKFQTTNAGKTEVVEKGVFISKIEARIEEKVHLDREINMEFGQGQRTIDRDSGRTVKIAPGWRQISRDGHYLEHNGSLSLSQIYEYIAEIFMTRKSFGERKVVLATGEGGIDFLSKLIAKEASQFNYIDTNFVQKRSDPQGVHDNELEYGAQFTKIRMPNGYSLEMVYDPIKDDRKLFPEKAPGTNRTRESFAMDIFDFGDTTQKAVGASAAKNVCMVMQDGVESYFAVSNVYDFQTGAVKDGGNVAMNSKELGIYREIPGSLCVWDTTRIGRIQFNAGTAY